MSSASLSPPTTTTSPTPVRHVPNAPSGTTAQPTHVTIREAAAILGLTVKWVWELTNTGRLPAARDHQGNWLIAVEWVEAYARWRAGPALLLSPVGSAGA
jgi:predicted DNA-binding transcriptional regulator AlpA